MFSQISQPLAFAEHLLERYAQLAQASSENQLLASLVQSVAELSGCELGQLYLLDNTHTCLTLCGEWLDGRLQAHEASLPSDYAQERLLQYSLCQNQAVALTELSSGLYPVGCLPDSNPPWRSLLCLPLRQSNGQVCGLLLTASRDCRELQGFIPALIQMGTLAISQARLLRRLRYPEQSPAAETAAPEPLLSSGYGLLGQSEPMQHVYRLISKVLHSPVSVLVTGETGTGKELVARAIHDRGLRRTRAFVVQNCATLPENLLESELFGYRKGAFTGADQDKPGLFDQADGGTLFLDEIGDMPLPLQAKLLRVLQEGEVRPLGGDSVHKVDVRIIAATHRNLRQRVETGLFREDLFYRLSVFPIELPPLCERGDDLLLLARHFADTASALLQRDNCRWSDAALAHLRQYRFPGNVRELKGTVERAVLLCEGGELLPSHFNLTDWAEDEKPLTLRERLDCLERNLLIDCLRKNGGNQTQAACELGVPRRTLLYRLQRLKIDMTDL